MAGDNMNPETRMMASDTMMETEILDNINQLLERKLELALRRYLNSLSSGENVSSLFSGTGVRLQYDNLKNRVGNLISVYEGNIKAIAEKELGLTDENDVEVVELVELQSQPRRQQKPPSAMARKFLAAGDHEIQEPDMSLIEAYETAKRDGKESYFFYGTLMDATTLQRILRVKERPQLRPSCVVGYKIKLWGPYPALLDGPTGHVVRGMTYEVEGGGMKDRLAEYETGKYRCKSCTIDFDDGTSVDGKTFVWAGDESELKEGSFDLKDWQQDHVLDS